MKTKRCFFFGAVCMILLMINLAYADNLIFNEIDSTAQKPSHSDTFRAKYASTEKNAVMVGAAGVSFNPITVIWPESGYYYVTDVIWLDITTTNNSTCSYSLDGNQIQEMNYTHDTEHFQLITHLKDNMKGNPYVADFSCTDESGTNSFASTYFKINTTDLDKYILRRNIGQWNYLGSEQVWFDDESIQSSYSGYYKQGEITNRINIIVYDGSNSAENFIEKDIAGETWKNIFIKNIGNKKAYAYEQEEGGRNMAWNSGNIAVIDLAYSFDNSTPVFIDYPDETAADYMDKYPSNLYVPCLPNWTESGSKCQINNHMLIGYYDSNSCGINVNLPSDNGTYADCDFCLPNIHLFYTEWSSCSAQGIKTRTKYFIDSNYATCCAMTDLGSDCAIRTPAYQNSTETASCPTFNLTLKSPADGIYNTLRIKLDINSSKKLSKLDYIDYSQNSPKWTILCTKCYGYNKTRSFIDGQHNLTIRANSTDGKTVFAGVSFFIDSKVPQISVNQPRGKEFTNGSALNIKYTEENVQSIELFYGDDKAIKNNCAYGKNKICSFSADLKDYDRRDITYKFRLTDIAGNFKESRNITATVDTTAPKITKFNYSINGRYVTFNISIDETNFDRVNYKDLNDANPRWNTLCSSLRYGNCIVKKYFRAGNHDVTIQVTDKAGNSAEKKIQFIII